MRFTSRGVIEDTPEFNLHAKLGPISVEGSAEGSGTVAVGPVTARCSAIPLRMTIPFLRRRGGVQTVGSIGPFGVRIDRFDVEARAFGVRVGGVLGKDGLDGHVDGKVACRIHFDMAGTIPGKVARATISLVDGDDVDTA